MRYSALRWVATAAIAVCYVLRVLWLRGWYIVSYALAIYLLNLFIAFLTPRFDPAQREEDEIGVCVSVAVVDWVHSVCVDMTVQRMGRACLLVPIRSSNHLSGDCLSLSSGE